MTRHRLHTVPWLRHLGRLLIAEWLAITIGRDIFAWRALSERELRHELAHVAQWRRRPFTFPVRYLWCHLRYGYAANPYELEAKEAERRGATGARQSSWRKS